MNTSKSNYMLVATLCRQQLSVIFTLPLGVLFFQKLRINDHKLFAGRKGSKRSGGFSFQASQEGLGQQHCKAVVIQ